MPIRFVLAKRAPDCSATTGIERIDGRVLPHYDTTGVIYTSTLTGPGDADVKSLSIWPPEDYYNIWIVKYIDGPSGGWAGYAIFPDASSRFDGTVLTAKYAYPLAVAIGDWIVPHELGHAFNLLHTFEGSTGLGSCPPNSSCGTQGDMICDTEPHEYISGSCLPGDNPCTGVPYAGVQYNFMSYFNCSNRFTKDQKERVMVCINNYRMGLTNSLGGTLPDPAFTPPVASCIPGIKNPGNGMDIGPRNISIGGMSTSSNGYTGDGNRTYLDRTCIQAPAQLLTGNTYTMNISSGGWVEKVSAWIDYDNDGNFEPGELIFSHAGSAYFEVHTGSVTIPADATTGTILRMRVMSDKVSAPDPDPCTDIEFGQTEDYSVMISNPASVADMSSGVNTISCYPNPADDILHVQCTGTVNISVYNLEGQLLLQQKSANSIPVNTLADGLYIVKLSDAADGRVVKNAKFIKRSK